MRNLVLFSDGTSNSSLKAQKTNVWRMFEALDKSQAGQVAQYDDGVGTSRVKFLAAIGNAFGWGLKRNVLDQYKFVCRNYQPGDRIFGFGFSRGAFTIRVLASLIDGQGLVDFRSEEELDKRARIVYRLYRNRCFPGYRWSPVGLFRGVRDRAIRLFQQATHGMLDEHLPVKKGIPIHFLGLWDTVSAYGMPVEEFKPAINWLFWPLLFDNLVLPRAVQHAYHALSLDDERTAFHPVVWDEHEERVLAASPSGVAPGRLNQVWFAGVHSNVGGGYPEDHLAMITLDWMMGNAERHELRLIPSHRQAVQDAQSPYGQLYDPRAGLGAFYRYTPRQIKEFYDVDGKTPLLPVVHGSVIMRMACGTDRYAPTTLPPAFMVLAPDGSKLHMPGAMAAPQVAQSSAHPNAALEQAMASLGTPNPSAIELALDTIWWRRVCYFTTLGLTLALLAFPLFGGHASDKYSRTLSGVVEPVIVAASAMVPSQAEAWIAALRALPIQLSIVLVLLFVSLMIGHTLKSRIRDRATFAWHAELQDKYLKWLADHERRARARALLVALVSFALLLAVELNNRGSKSQDQVRVVVVIAAIWVVWRCGRSHAQLKEIGEKEKTTGPVVLPPTLSLRCARSLRLNDPLFKVYEVVGNIIVPGLFGCAMVLTVAAIGNRAMFDIANSAGAVCTATPGLARDQEKLLGAPRIFPTSSPCWASGIVLERDGRYRITITDADGAWTDDSIATDVEGFAAAGLLHTVATPLKRWWSANWFAPIARVGQYGNEEYLLEPAAPYYRRANSDEAEQASKALPDHVMRPKRPDPAANERRRLVSHISARSSGELFIFVNDAVMTPPFMLPAIYANNGGTATIKVERVGPDGKVKMDCELREAIPGALCIPKE